MRISVPSLLFLLLTACGTRSDAGVSYELPPLTAPTSLRGSATSVTSCELTWSRVRGATRYDVQYALQGEAFLPPQEEGHITQEQVIVGDLTPFTTYRFRVRAVRGEKRSPYSEEILLHTSLDWSLFPGGSDENLDIATWNIQHFPKNGYDTVGLAGQALNAMAYDIIALQEMESEPRFEEMVAASERYTGYISGSAAYNINLGLLYDPQTITVLDTFELFLGDILPFPRPPLVFQLSYRGGTPFWLINVHLKCCGDGYIDEDQYDDEEWRRLSATRKLANWVEMFHPDEPVIILGDWNDDLTDPEYNNVFTPFYDKEEPWFFSDLEIASSSSALWSYPLWPSHLDHILLSGEFTELFSHPTTEIMVLPLHHYFYDGLTEYDERLTDHLPLMLTLPPF